MALCFHRPIDPGAEVRHWAKRIETVAAGWRKAWIGRGGAVDVEREIPGQLFALEDVVEQFAKALAEPYRMMRDLRILPPRAEIQQEQPHRKPRGAHFQARCRPQLLRRKHFGE